MEFLKSIRRRKRSMKTIQESPCSSEEENDPNEKQDTCVVLRTSVPGYNNETASRSSRNRNKQHRVAMEIDNNEFDKLGLSDGRDSITMFDEKRHLEYERKLSDDFGDFSVDIFMSLPFMQENEFNVRGKDNNCLTNRSSTCTTKDKEETHENKADDIKLCDQVEQVDHNNDLHAYERYNEYNSVPSSDIMDIFESHSMTSLEKTTKENHFDSLETTYDCDSSNGHLDEIHRSDKSGIDVHLNPTEIVLPTDELDREGFDKPSELIDTLESSLSTDDRSSWIESDLISVVEFSDSDLDVSADDSDLTDTNYVEVYSTEEGDHADEIDKEEEMEDECNILDSYKDESLDNYAGESSFELEDKVGLTNLPRDSSTEGLQDSNSTEEFSSDDSISIGSDEEHKVSFETLRKKTTNPKMRNRRSSYLQWESGCVVSFGEFAKPNVPDVCSNIAEQVLTPERIENINSSLSFIREELTKLRVYDQHLAKIFLKLREDIQTLKFQWTNEDHEYLLRELTFGQREHQDSLLIDDSAYEVRAQLRTVGIKTVDTGGGKRFTSC